MGPKWIAMSIRGLAGVAPCLGTEVVLGLNLAMGGLPDLIQRSPARRGTWPGSRTGY